MSSGIPAWQAVGLKTRAKKLGFEVRRCEELRRKTPLVDDLHDPETSEHAPPRPPIIWALHRFASEATNAAYRHKAHAIIWDFQLFAAEEQRSARADSTGKLR